MSKNGKNKMGLTLNVTPCCVCQHYISVKNGIYQIYLAAVLLLCISLLYSVNTTALAVYVEPTTGQLEESLALLYKIYIQYIYNLPCKQYL